MFSGYSSFLCDIQIDGFNKVYIKVLNTNWLAKCKNHLKYY